MRGLFWVLVSRGFSSSRVGGAPVIEARSRSEGERMKGEGSGGEESMLWASLFTPPLFPLAPRLEWRCHSGTGSPLVLCGNTLVSPSRMLPLLFLSALFNPIKLTILTITPRLAQTGTERLTTPPPAPKASTPRPGLAFPAPI